jgi:AhpD family alkylhydroperoxidase
MAAHAPSCTLQSPEVDKKRQEPYQTRSEKDVLDKTTKELLMLALACVFRCPRCTEDHMKAALQVGASKAEVVEVVLTTLSLSGQVHDKHCSG